MDVSPLHITMSEATSLAQNVSYYSICIILEIKLINVLIHDHIISSA